MPFWNFKLWRNRRRAGASPPTQKNTNPTTTPSLVPAEKQAGSHTAVPTMVPLSNVELSVIPVEESSQVTFSGGTDASEIGASSTIVGPVETNHTAPTDNTNTFNTLDIRPQDQPRSKNAKIFWMQANPAEIPIGLTWLDIGCKNPDIGVTAFTLPLSPDSIEIHLDSPVDTVLHSAGCTWLNVAAQDCNFQHGKFSTGEDQPPSQKRQKKNSRQVTFPKPFQGNPRVIVWLNGFHMSNKHNWRCKGYATKISPQGFMIHIDTWADTVLYSAAASWIAYDPNLPNISSGSFNIMDVRPWYIPRKKNQGAATFHKAFQSVPRVLAALNWLDVSNRTNLRLKLEIGDVSAKGLTWHLDTWDRTVLYSAGASYIATLDV